MPLKKLTGKKLGAFTLASLSGGDDLTNNRTAGRNVWVGLIDERE